MDIKTETLYEEIRKNALIAEHAPYLIKFAENEEEIRATQRLRYRVFCEEQGHTADATEDGLDIDEFDSRSVYLLVKKEGISEPVGTYRIIGNPSGLPEDMYSATEFICNSVSQESLARVLELGRSCVDPEYRNSSVISLLWAGLAETMKRTGSRYLVGCTSMDATSAAAAWAIWDSLKEGGHFSPEFDMEPRPDFYLERPPEEEIEAYKAEHPNLKKEYPPLLKGYMSLGGQICGKLAYDKAFGVFDFLVVLDIYNMPQRFIRHFFPNGLPEK